MINNGLFTSTTDLWSTPQQFYNKYNEQYHFELDVCADDTNHKCNKYFAKEHDYKIKVLEKVFEMKESINSLKLQLRLIESQMSREWGNTKN